MPTFTIPGKPFAKQRHRTTRQGFTRTPAATVNYERVVGLLAMQHFPQPLAGPVRLRIEATFEPSASWSGKKKREALGTPHTFKPDMDNCCKSVLDGLNRIAWADDSQVAEIVATKRWGETAQVVVTVEAL